MDKERELIFGKESTEGITSIEVMDGVIELSIGEKTEIRPTKVIQWILAPKSFGPKWSRLDGDLHYKFIRTFDTLEEYASVKKRMHKNKEDFYTIADSKEAAMVYHGLTYFKSLKVEDVSVLFWDIETTGLTHNVDSKVLLISNTFVKNGKKERKLFAYDEYESEAAFLDAWCSFVRDCNPSILAGHNIFGFDLPYLDFCASNAGTSLLLGKDGSAIRFNNYESKFRKDGSQDYLYKRCFIYGREIVDTMFLAYHFDFARKYESYGLKQIIKQEGLEVKDRQFYDAGKIWERYQDPVEWERIKKYAEHDADDSYSLYKLMIPSYFYLANNIPKTFQQINYTATGSQINSFLVRSYLQQGHSIPKTSQPQQFEGAISLGSPGLYKNCIKWDIAAMYPSIMISYEIYDKEKDPKAHFLHMVKYFTKQRLENKKLAKETGNRYYYEVEQAGKQIINSAYGLLGSVGLNFNSSKNAELVTRNGREILLKAIEYFTDYKYAT